MSIKSFRLLNIIYRREYDAFSMVTFNSLVESYRFPLLYSSRIKIAEMFTIDFLSGLKPGTC